MFLNAPGDRTLPLCYSMNVHPGEGLDEVLAAIRDTVIPLKARLGVEGDFAVGLRLSNRAAEEGERRAEELRRSTRRTRAGEWASPLSTPGPRE